MSSHRKPLTPEGDESRMPAEPGFPPVSIPSGPRDTSLQPPEEEQPEPPLKLIRGALIALRRSGGFRFRTSVAVVFRDGRVAVAGGTHTRPKAVRRLNEDEQAELDRLIGAVEAANLPQVNGQQTGDTIANELIMRVGRRTRSYECFSGTCPSELDDLITRLIEFAKIEPLAPPQDVVL